MEAAFHGGRREAIDRVAVLVNHIGGTGTGRRVHLVVAADGIGRMRRIAVDARAAHVVAARLVVAGLRQSGTEDRFGRVVLGFRHRVPIRSKRQHTEVVARPLIQHAQQHFTTHALGRQRGHGAGGGGLVSVGACGLVAARTVIVGRDGRRSGAGSRCDRRGCRMVAAARIGGADGAGDGVEVRRGLRAGRHGLAFRTATTAASAGGQQQRQRSGRHRNTEPVLHHECSPGL